MANSVQVYGIAAALDWAENLNCPKWILYQGRQFMVKYEGSDMEESMSLLEKFLERMKSHDTLATYTLKFFEPQNTKLNEATKCDGGSFNFKLSDTPEQYNEMSKQRPYFGAVGKIQQAIEDKVAKKISLMLDNDDQPAYENKLGVIGEVLDHPVLGNILEKLALNFLMPNRQNVNQPDTQPANTIPMRAVGNIATDPELIKALEKLKKHDPKLTEHLTKLAIIAESDKPTFIKLTGILDLM